jgi:hypothetical protein
MGFVNYIKDGIKIVKLDRKSIKKVSTDKKATNTGIIILLIAGLLSVVGLYGIQGYYLTLIMAPLFTLVFFVLGVGILQVFVRMFGGRTNYVYLFRVLSHAAVMTWLWLLVFIPIIGDILNWAVLIWGIVVSIVAVETINHMKRAKAVLAVLIPFFLAAIVMLLVAWLALRNYGLA